MSIHLIIFFYLDLSSKFVLCKVQVIFSCHVSSLSDCNGIQSYNSLVCKRTFSHFAKLAK